MNEQRRRDVVHGSHDHKRWNDDLCNQWIHGLLRGSNDIQLRHIPGKYLTGLQQVQSVVTVPDKYKIPNPAQIRAFEALARTFTVAYGLAANLFARQLLISTFTGEVGNRTRPSRLLGRVGADYPD